jgi:predicted DCC family thiol-disulfide oxidoreductase YuxK
MSGSVAFSPAPEAEAPSTPAQRGIWRSALWRGWRQIWFQDESTLPLEIARIGIAAAMLLHYGLASPHLFTFWGDSGWLPRALLDEQLRDPWLQSVHFYFTAPWQWIAFHGLFLLCCAAMAAGWRTSWVKWLVLVGHISYTNRNPAMIYGVHAILACLLLILCFAPIGRALSLDRVREVRAAKRRDLNADPAPFTSPWAFACTRLMQIQMAVLFFFSAAHKLRGNDWWNGDAVWKVFVQNDYYNGFILDVLASQYWLANVATYGTVLIEIAYPFLIWQRRTRPYMLAGAIFLHLQFAFLMHLYFFSFVMIMGHMSFLRAAWLSRLGAWWKRKIGAMEMIYDGNCAFCKRSMAWLLAFDGLRQIGIRDFRSNPSPVVSDERLLKRLYLVLPDRRALGGFEAYRYVVLRVPGLWWLVPLFYLPVLSRLFGHPIYDWIAANRARL